MTVPEQVRPVRVKVLEPEEERDPEFLGNWDMDATEDLCSAPLHLDDLSLAHSILDAASIPMSEMSGRILWVAKRWLSLASANGHTPSCLCQQCPPARLIVAEYHRILLE